MMTLHGSRTVCGQSAAINTGTTLKTGSAQSNCFGAEHRKGRFL